MHDADWAWWVIIPSLTLGAVLTGYGLSVDCERADTACQRSASAAIWGGVGVASFGSLLGVSLVQASTASPPKSGAVAGLRLELMPSSESAHALSGARLQLTATLP